MINIVASKIYYDHRNQLPHHLKYSRAPSKREYDFKEGKYTPIYAAWGNGLRYIEESHAINILNEALERTVKLHQIEKNEPKIELLEEEINVITKILTDVLKVTPEIGRVILPSYESSTLLPDKEIGHLGEEYI
ncbi:MAG TPA: hypothetical protein EYH35_05095 [Thiotrichaceae bacterium]|nr:hypothetical protein [Thiotrichaceae bacterium]